MNALDQKKKEAEIMKMKYNIMDSEVRIEERKQEIERIGVSIESFEKRVREIEEELSSAE